MWVSRGTDLRTGSCPRLNRWQLLHHNGPVHIAVMLLTHSPLYLLRIYEELYKDLTQRNQNLSKDPSTCRPLDIPMYLLNLERDALLSGIDMHWEYR